MLVDGVFLFVVFFFFNICLCKDILFLVLFLFSLTWTRFFIVF